MKNYIFLWSILLLVTACSGDSSDGGGTTPVTPPTSDVKVAIVTEIETRAVAKKVYANGDQMNVWAKTYGSSAADDIVKNIKAQYNGSAWSLTPDVFLDQTKVKNAFIYALYPYASDFASTPGKLNIDVTKQEDILYSGSYVPVTYTTNTAKLKMKHALSLASFNIAKDGYTGAGKLQKLTLYGDSIYTKGVMSVENGKVAGKEKGEVSSAFDKTIEKTGWKTDVPRLWVIPLPFNTKVTKAYLKAVIDGKEYTSTLPEVEMRIGFMYLFHLVLTDNGLEFIPDQTTSVSMNEESDEVGALEGHAILKLTHQGKGELSSFFILGDNVFGTVKWDGNNGETYTNGASHIYETDGTHAVFTETWNSIGFELRNLKGIQAVDISQYE